MHQPVCEAPEMFGEPELPSAPGGLMMNCVLLSRRCCATCRCTTWRQSGYNKESSYRQHQTPPCETHMCKHIKHEGVVKEPLTKPRPHPLPPPPLCAQHENTKQEDSSIALYAGAFQLFLLAALYLQNSALLACSSVCSKDTPSTG